MTGVSGSGKSTLINDTFFKIAHTALNGATTATPAPYRSIQGLEHFDKVIDIDQSPIGRTPRSNLPLTPESSLQSVNYLQEHKSLARVVISRDALVLTSAEGAVKRAKAMA